MKKLLAIAALAATMATPAIASDPHWAAGFTNEIADYNGEDKLVRADRLLTELQDMLDNNQIYSARWWKIQSVVQSEGWWTELEEELNYDGSMAFAKALIATFVDPVDSIDLPEDYISSNAEATSSTFLGAYVPSSQQKYQLGPYNAEINGNPIMSVPSKSNFLINEVDDFMSEVGKQIEDAVEQAYNHGFDDGFEAGFNAGWKAAENHYGIN